MLDQSARVRTAIQEIMWISLCCKDEEMEFPRSVPTEHFVFSEVWKGVIIKSQAREASFTNLQQFWSVCLIPSLALSHMLSFLLPNCFFFLTFTFHLRARHFIYDEAVLKQW